MANNAFFDPPVVLRNKKVKVNLKSLRSGSIEFDPFDICETLHQSIFMIYYSSVVLYFYSKSNKGEGCGGDGGCYWCLLFSWDSPNLSQMRPRHVRLRKYKCSAKNQTLSFGVKYLPIRGFERCC